MPKNSEKSTIAVEHKHGGTEHISVVTEVLHKETDTPVPEAGTPLAVALEQPKEDEARSLQDEGDKITEALATVEPPAPENAPESGNFKQEIVEVERDRDASRTSGVEKVRAALLDAVNASRDKQLMSSPQQMIAASADFQQLEQTVAKNFEAFHLVGNALAKIRDNEYYKPPYDTFQEYLEKRWGYTRQRAHQLMIAARQKAHLSTVVDVALVPRNERAIRELLTVKDEFRVPVLKAAHKLKKGNDITTEEIAEAIKRVPGAARPAKAKKPTANPSIKFKSAIKALELAERFLNTADISKIDDAQKAMVSALCKRVAERITELKLTA